MVVITNIEVFLVSVTMLDLSECVGQAVQFSDALVLIRFARRNLNI
jgi:hypothetical protein